MRCRPSHSVKSPSIECRNSRLERRRRWWIGVIFAIGLVHFSANPVWADKFGLFSSQCANPGWKVSHIRMTDVDVYDLNSMRKKAAQLASPSETFAVGIVSNDGSRVVRRPPENPRCQAGEAALRLRTGDGNRAAENPEIYRITRNYFTVFYLNDGNWIADEKYPCRDAASDRVRQFREAGRTATFATTRYSWMSNDPKGLSASKGLVRPSEGLSAGWTCVDGSN